jgi:plastocyanin
MNRIASCALLTLALLAPSCGGGEESEPTGAARETIEVVATDFAFEPASIEVDEPGIYAFRLVNEGESTHALEIEGEGAEAATAEIGSGESAEVKIELQAGRYELYCPVGNHKEMGMEGTLSVGGAAGGGGTTTTDGEEDEGPTY